MKHVPLKRKTPLRARSWASTPKLGGPKARRRKVSDPTPEQRAAVMARTGGMCAHVGPLGQCPNLAKHVHHRKLRSQGGTNAIKNLVPLCHRCHTQIHRDGDRAYDEGWLVRSWAPVTEWPERWFR